PGGGPAAGQLDDEQGSNHPAKTPNRGHEQPPKGREVMACGHGLPMGWETLSSLSSGVTMGRPWPAGKGQNGYCTLRRTRQALEMALPVVALARVGVGQDDVGLVFAGDRLGVLDPAADHHLVGGWEPGAVLLAEA